ncbi:hypothetical protein PWT90_03406 [Aphanocladium album]|nr:hypothetical protein PWT90_03406 [Aphanocladium album]
MSSPHQRHSGPVPTGYARGRSSGPDSFPSGSFHRSDVGNDSPASPRRRSAYYARPPPTYEPYLADRRSSVPLNYAEPQRGRHRRRDPLPDDEVSWRAAHRPRSRSRTRIHDDDRRARSQGNTGPPRSKRPPRSKGASRSGDHARSQSASFSSDRDKGQRSSPPWWQNPIVKTCAVTAISTGVCAALDNRGDPGRWKGTKGVKVAVAAVGSAVVDGFLGSKHPNKDTARDDTVNIAEGPVRDEATVPLVLTGIGAPSMMRQLTLCFSNDFEGPGGRWTESGRKYRVNTVGG